MPVLKLQTIRLIGQPMATGPDGFPWRQGVGHAHHRNQLPVAAHLNLQHVANSSLHGLQPREFELIAPVIDSYVVIQYFALFIIQGSL